jgi:potassium/hydrogen antiporter
MIAEPQTTALAMVIVGALLIAAALFSRASDRLGLPLALVFLLVGMLAGSEGIGGLVFEDYQFAYRLGTVALVMILFDGGLNTPVAIIRRVAAPAGVLATFGVVGTAAMVAVGARVLGLEWTHAVLLGAVVSSTDAAAVFSVLRGSGISLKKRVGATLEVESGANDPMAVILTIAVTATMLDPNASLGWPILWTVAVQLVVGGAAGLGAGYAARYVLARTRLVAGGLYAVLLIGVALFTFALPTLAQGSGFLAVYIAGVVLGNGALPYRSGLLRILDAIAWLGQVTMFLVMGLLVFPSRLFDVAPIGIALALFLAIVARPLVVTLCLLPFQYRPHEVGYIGWVGLRGAVPIILAVYPILAGAPGAEQIFDIVFFIVVVSAIIPGATVRALARRLRLESGDPPAPLAVLSVESLQPMKGELLSFYIDEDLPVAGERLSDVPFPEGTAVTLIVRGGELVAPKGQTILEPGDHLYVLAHEEERELIQLLLGRPEAR